MTTNAARALGLEDEIGSIVPGKAADLAVWRLESLAELGVLVLLFEIGLHTDLKSLMNVGAEAMTVALVGVALPFGLGYGTSQLLGLDVIPSIVAGAALTATSIGISARTLSDLNQLNTPEGQIVLGAAVLDDIVGLVILSVVAGLVGGAAITAGGVAITSALAIGFVIGAIVIGGFVMPYVFRLIAKVEASGTLGVAGLVFAFLLAWLADAAGSATIIGAFSAGLVLHDTPQRQATPLLAVAMLSKSLFRPVFMRAVPLRGGGRDGHQLLGEGHTDP